MEYGIHYSPAQSCAQLSRSDDPVSGVGCRTPVGATEARVLGVLGETFDFRRRVGDWRRLTVLIRLWPYTSMRTRTCVRYEGSHSHACAISILMSPGLQIGIRNLSIQEALFCAAVLR